MGMPFFISFFITREFLPAMLRDAPGSIININSPPGFFGGPVGHLVPAKVSIAYLENNPGSEDRIQALAKFIPRRLAWVAPLQRLFPSLSRKLV